MSFPIDPAEVAARRPVWEYLVSHGKAGAFGRFTSSEMLDLARGARVVIRSPRGLELGTVLCAATDRHARLLPAVVSGPLLRRASATDIQEQTRLDLLGQKLFDTARRRILEEKLPLEVVDVDFLLDGQRVILQGLVSGQADVSDFLAALEKEFAVQVWLENLAEPASSPEEETHGGCGKPDCGKTGGDGGCSSCGTGGGCTSCASGKKVDLRDYFGHLRQKMEARQRTPLL